MSSKNLRLFSAVPGAGNGANDRALLDEPGEQAEAGALEMLADVGDQQRIAKVRLVGSVL